MRRTQNLETQQIDNNDPFRHEALENLNSYKAINIHIPDKRKTRDQNLVSQITFRHIIHRLYSFITAQFAQVARPM